MPFNLIELSEGMEIPPLKKLITQQNINTYARASRDFNPVHIDEEFARKTPLGGTVAHGMLVLAYISEMMTGAFGEKWISGGKLDVRFRAAARPGDTLDVSGRITKIEKISRQVTVRCSVLCSNEKGEQVITGDAAVTFAA